MTVYISAPYELRDYAVQLRRDLFERGVEVIARWIDSEVPDYNPQAMQATMDRNARWACVDIEDLEQADVMVLVNPAEWRHKGSGGRHVETGIALGNGVPVVIVGERTNVFHYLAEATLIPYPAIPVDLVKAITDAIEARGF